MHLDSECDQDVKCPLRHRCRPRLHRAEGEEAKEEAGEAKDVGLLGRGRGGESFKIENIVCPFSQSWCFLACKLFVAIPNTL